MSLSRILNDDPSPMSAPTMPTSLVPIDPALMHKAPRLNSGVRSPPPRSYPHSQLNHHGEPPPPPRGHIYQPLAYQGAGGWDPYTGEWVQGDIFPLGPGGNYYSDRQQFVSHQEHQRDTSSRMYYKEEEEEEEEEEDDTPRKRRKGGDEDTDYRPPGQRRLGSRRYPPRTKQYRPPSPHGNIIEPDTTNEDRRPHTADEHRLASSDLEDCEEIWIGELGEYMLETQKRQKQVEVWFEASVLERNSTTAQTMSRHYAARIARIPPPPPSPPPFPHPLSIEDDLLSTIHTGSPQHPTDYAYGMEGGYRLSPGRDRPFGPSAEDAARDFEESMLGRGDAPSLSSAGVRDKGKVKEAAKRPASGDVSDGSSDLEIPTTFRKGLGPANKKRKIDKDGDITDDLERSITGDHPSASNVAGTLTKGKGKGKQPQREMSLDSSASTTPKYPRKKPGPRKKLDTFPPDTVELLGLGASASASADVTPISSRLSSPALATSIVFELDEFPPALKKAKKVDDAAMLKRLKTLEETQRKVWTNIARRDVAKVYKYHAMGYQHRRSQLERVAKLASTQARRPFTRTAKANKDVQSKAKRLMREMLVFWKKNEREERDVRKREQKEAIDRAKLEDEKREAARQARKLEFLISQTELYSHFVGSKLKTSEVQGDGDNAAVPIGVSLDDVDHSALEDINFDDDDTTNIHRHAKHNAQEAIALARQRAQQFDAQAALERKTNEAIKLAKGQAHIRDHSGERPSGSGSGTSATPLVDLDSDELNFQNPTSLSGPLTIQQPQMLMAQLKEYQLKGLNWLATLYEQGINGILADEMGLGKTVQSISLLAYLAETHDIWGPFLVVAPASTLHNWQQEITRFVPGLKALPYWGNVKDRATLRKFWSKKEISYNQDAPFHVLITSYQLVTQDQQYFQRVKWQYMILDEAQNIKNSSSVRWKTLLGFHCRNRLLLTGTPIQNNMQELWALLHFIMPSLFDSHDEFNEWFSKDIENAAENKGSKMNEHQLRRLHMILKPFMLRRVKRNVQNELSEKIEKDIYVDLSARQRSLYKALLANVSVADLLAKAANIGDADSARSLMNLVMQFRKVCNHPELFERADVVAPFSFARFGQSGPLIRDGDFINLPYSTRSPIEYVLPKLLYQDGGLLDVPYEHSRRLSASGRLASLMNIWSTDWIQHSLYDAASSSFSFLRLLDMSPSEAHVLHLSPLIRRRLLAIQEDSKTVEEGPFYVDNTFAAHSAQGSLRFQIIPSLLGTKADAHSGVRYIARSSWKRSCLSRPGLKWFVPPVVAPAITVHCADRTFLERQTQLLEGPLESLALYGLPPNLRESEEACATFQFRIPGLSPVGLFDNSTSDQLPLSTMQVPEAKRLIYDSAKLACLDTLLQELKAGDHRVLIYFQMTRMMDLMEEYLIYRQFKYLRLDGSSKLEDRRDMVIDWQTRPDIFIFLLSTRAGGLGINLTAADTVVFYDHDWNPSNDAQAMDRAHRLGQTQQVTVYRLITKGTIDERIIQLARVKKDVQDIVVGNKNFTDVTKPSEIVSLLLNDDQLANFSSSTTGLSNQNADQRPAGDNPDGEPIRDLWNEEGDDFFGHSAATGPAIASDGMEDDNGTPGPSRGKKRNTGGSRGRRPGSKAASAVKRKSLTGTGNVTADLI